MRLSINHHSGSLKYLEDGLEWYKNLSNFNDSTRSKHSSAAAYTKDGTSFLFVKNSAESISVTVEGN